MSATRGRRPKRCGPLTGHSWGCGGFEPHARQFCKLQPEQRTNDFQATPSSPASCRGRRHHRIAGPPLRRGRSCAQQKWRDGRGPRQTLGTCATTQAKQAGWASSHRPQCGKRRMHSRPARSYTSRHATRCTATTKGKPPPCSARRLPAVQAEATAVDHPSGALGTHTVGRNDYGCRFGCTWNLAVIGWQRGQKMAEHRGRFQSNPGEINQHV